ncbi:HEAT repeat domain-containing protein [Vacuolonema iberomarrocanum]|uniref:HEAT repeat domain-containing protein n=1 Tax=Vacuolonema iberomarrocanum TaxID=3454632 RepID=UPI0019DA368E|nr:HEAT repeat domain-containing protein [filamentous cyanobacterium LEGE 07170]
MVFETAALFAGSWLVNLGKQKLGEILLQGIDQKLNPSDFQRLLDQAVQEANKQVPELFMACEMDGLKGARRFVSQFLVGRAIEELQKPLKCEGKPDAGLLQDLFLQEVKGHPIAPQLKQDSLLPWMQAFVDAYFDSTTACLKIHYTLKAYCQKLSSKLGKMVFDGMAVDGKVVDESGDLTKLFVMPDVKAHDSRWAKELEIERPDALSDDPQERILWEQRQQAEFLKKAEQANPFSAKELLKDNKRRVVLLGAPGAGKTTLTNYLLITAARQCSQVTDRAAELQVPILIRIRDLSRKPELSILEFAEYFVKQELGLEELPADFFDYWLERGQALILLDGLDEVPDAVERRKTVDKLELFLSDCPQCPVLITSRPAGYRNDYFSRDDYPHYELQSFDDEKIDQFIDHWYESRVDLEDERRRRKANLRRALKDKPRIKRLARNPLLLTLIALIHRYRNLPKHRHELYDSAVETLISLWDKSKELTDFTVNRTLKYLELDDIRRLMEKLAYWIHAQGSVDEAENGTQIGRDTLIRQLGKMIIEIKAPESIKSHLAEKEAERFLDEIIRDRAGLLSQQGQDRYSFVHKTFQEYLCAQEILYRQNNQDPDDDDYTPHVRKHIEDYLHQQHWREVLLLLVAQQKPNPAKSSLKAILNAESDYEEWLHRDLLFAGSCLAENTNVSDEGTICQILDSLVALEVSVVPETAETLRKEVFKVIGGCRDTLFADRLMQKLSEHSSEIDRWRLIDYQIELAPNAAAISLLGLLKDGDSNVRSRAAEALGGLGQDSDAAVSSLLGLLKDGDSNVRSRAAEALGGLGQGSDAVVANLLELLKDETMAVRYFTADALGYLGQDSDAVVSGLLRLLKNEEPVVIHSAAEALRRLGQTSDAVVAGLLGLLKDEDSDVRSRAAQVLGRLGQNSDAVVSGLLGLLKDEDSDVRSRAAQVLGRLGQNSDAVVSGLLGLLKDEDSNVRSRMAEALGYLGQDSDAVVTGLLKLLKDAAWNVRYFTAEALGRLGQGSDAVVAGLLELLKDENKNMRYCTAKSLGRLGQNSNTVVSSLLELLKDKDSNVRSRAAETLVQLGQNSNAVVSSLLELLKDKDSNVRSRAAEMLVQLGQSSDEVMKSLLELLKDNASYVYSRAAKTLVQLGQGSDAVVVGLLELLKDEEHAVDYSAAEALVQLGQGSDALVAELLRLLKDDASYVRFRAAEVLGKLGYVSDAVVAGLLAFLKDNSFNYWTLGTVNQQAAKSLVALSKQSDVVKPVLVNWIQQHRQDDFVGVGLDALWEMVS